MQLSDDAISRLLDSWPVARLATVGPSGAPHLVPIVFVWMGEELWSPIDGKPKTGRELQRIRNVRREPRVSLLLDEYTEDWTRLWWLRIDGEARIVTAPDAGANAARSPVAEALRRKYAQYDTVPLFAGEPTLLAIRIGTVRSWRAGD